MKPSDFKKRREELGFSQSRLAHILGVHRITIIRWEKGRTLIPIPISLVISEPVYDQLAKHKKFLMP